MQLIALFSLLLCAARAQNAFDLTQSTYLGDTSDDEAVVAVAIQSNGDVVVVANLGFNTSVAYGAVLLNGATATSRSCVLILSPDSKSVKFAARIGEDAMDAAIDSSDRIYIAMGVGGVLALDASGGVVRWTSPSASSIGTGGVTLRALIHRIDVGKAGTVAVLMSGIQQSITSRPDTDKTSGPGTIIVFQNDGTEIAQYAGPSGRNVLVRSCLTRELVRNLTRKLFPGYCCGR
jgi:outer membrane protein assembly factor BamB